jgi:hypothetical protein
LKVVFCTPSLAGPTSPYIKSLEQSIPLIVGAGWAEGYVQEIGNAYISNARSVLAHRAVKHGADVLIYLDYDLSWEPEDLLTLLETPGDVVGGTYRFKQDKEEYMGVIRTDANERPICREDGCIRAAWVPAGFLKITRRAVERFSEGYPELCFEKSVDLFNHGAHKGIWWGEDAAFCRRWNDLGEEVWLVPNLNITHWAGDRAFPGNFHEFMCRQPGGSKEEKQCVV